MLTLRRARRSAPCCPPPPPEPTTPGSPRLARVALVGNPNVGKSTLFNRLTGARQEVGNWPGRTVTVATGQWDTPSGRVELIDLPGTYSLRPDSPDEELVRDLLADPGADGRPDVVVAVLDAGNLARNLYLFAQVRDTGLPVVAALTMGDAAAGRGLRVDVPVLADELGVPVVEVDPRAADGARRLAAEVLRAPNRATPERGVPERGVPERGVPGQRVPERSEPDRDGRENDELAADRQFRWVRDVVARSVRRPERSGPTRSDRIDQVLTSRWFGLPIFLLVMWAVFVATTRLAGPLQRGLSALVDGPGVDGARRLTSGIGLGGTWAAGLVVEGIVPGVGQLLTFVPLMAIMFAVLTVLEDSGYMARAAFVADRFLRLVGLPGHAFLPLIVGFGCNVPAIAGTRILADGRHRVMTALLVPFVSCSARLTVYVLLANVFFGDDAGTVVFGMYLVSVLLVVVVGVGLRHTLLRGQPRTALLLDLPPYRRPTARVITTYTWQRLRGFLRTAGGVIVATVGLVWLLSAVPLNGGRFGEVAPGDSLYGGASKAVSVVFAPAGFADWHAAGALLTGFVAKEAVVSTFAQTYDTADPSDPATAGHLGEDLADTFDRSSGGHPGAAALAFMVFLLAYTPCVATVAAQRSEIGARWTWLGIGMQLAVAWALATAVFQIGRLLT